MAIVANKNDLYESEEVDEEEAKQFAKDLDIIFGRTSASSGEGIDAIFEEIGNRILNPNLKNKNNKVYYRAKTSDNNINNNNNYNSIKDNNNTYNSINDKNNNKSNTINSSNNNNIRNEIRNENTSEKKENSTKKKR